MLHALLQAVHEPGQGDDSERRIQRVMQAIDEPRAAPVSGGSDGPSSDGAASKWPGLVSVLSMAATVLVACGLFWMWASTPGPTAYARVQESIQQASWPTDRQYQVLTYFSSPGRKPLEIEAQLYVRGGDKFALCHPRLTEPRRVWVGSNGTMGWYTAEADDIRTNADLRDLMDWARDDGVRLPNLRLTDLLSRFADQYDLELLTSEKLAGHGPTTWTRIRGTRNSLDPPRPDVVELWADPDTGVAEHLVLTWNRDPDETGLMRIELIRSGERAVPDEWYEPECHRLTAENLR
jgi:hypothetical protein